MAHLEYPSIQERGAIGRAALLENFVRAYDAWRAAENAIGEAEDHEPEEVLQVLANADAEALVKLIRAREALGS